MTYTKKFLQTMSVSLGFGGKINETVLKKVAEAIANEMTRADLLGSVNYEAFLEEKNEKQTSDPSLGQHKTS